MNKIKVSFPSWHISISSCERRSWRGLTANNSERAAPGQPEAAHPSLFLGMYLLSMFPHQEPFQGPESNALLRPSAQRIWLNPIQCLYKLFFNSFNFLLLFNYSCSPFLSIPPPHPGYKLFKMLLERYRNLLLLPMPKTSLVGKFPSLINLPPTKLEWPASFCSLSLPSAYAVPFWISPAGSSLGSSEPTRV